MAKRFIDTELFNDEWYMDLPKDAKILWLYMITKCSPAGFFKMNEKLCKVQTGITDIKGALKGLQRGLREVDTGAFFVNGFLEFQYPGFPNSNVRQQASAIKQLKEYDLWDEEKNEIIKGASKGLQRGYGNVTGIDNGIGNENIIKGKHLFSNSEYYDLQKFIIEIETNEKYLPFDCEFYHESVKNWSAEGNMKKDWIATARNWMLRDVKDGKVKLKKEYEQKFKQDGKQSYNDKISEYLNRERNY